MVLNRIILFAILCFAGTSGYSQENLSVYNYWRHMEDPSMTTYRYLLNLADEQIDRRKGVIENLKNKKDWEERQTFIRQKLEEMSGPFPEKTPLNPVITGTIRKNDYTVEKLYFESRPGYYVTAAFFIPNNKQKKHPAILYCIGHSMSGFRSRAYQTVILNLVKKGFAVLTFDPVGQGERLFYPGEKFSSTQEHSYAGVQLYLSGRPLDHYFIWDGIRAVDYLCSRKEVDTSRIGLTGRSGGGTQTAYIGAWDDRIVAAAPECYITSCEYLLRSRGPQDAEQVMTHSIFHGIDMSDYLIVRTPKPTLMITTTGDIFSIQGARDAYAETQKAYRALGYPENIQMVEDNAGHSSTVKNREALYTFLCKHLNHEASCIDEDVELLTEKELTVTSEGQVSRSFENYETPFSLNKSYVADLVRKLNGKKDDADLKQKIINITGYQQQKTPSNYIFSGRLSRDNYIIEKYLLKGSGGYYIPLLRFVPRDSNGKIALLLDEQGKAEAAGKEGLADKMTKAGYQVFIPDLNGTGELGGGYKTGSSIIKEISLNLWFAGILTNKSFVGLRSEEITIIRHFINTINQKQTSVDAIAKGILTSDLLHANYINKLFKNVILINPLETYKSIVDEESYHPKFAMSAAVGMLKVYDLPDLFIPENRYLIVNPVDAADRQIDKDTFDTHYSDIQRKLGDKLEVHIGQHNANDEIIRWINK